MTHAQHNLNPAATMEAEEQALVKEERVDEAAALAAERHDEAIAEVVDKPNMAKQGDIHPQVALHTDQLAEQPEATPAAEMEAEERDLVIENSVDDVRTFAESPVSDQTIRQQALTKEAQILPNQQDKSSR